MKTLLAFCLFFVEAYSFAQKAEIKLALEYLNKVRANPSMFSKEIGVNLSQVPRRSLLQWNDTLALVAQKKAEEMAKRDYLSHVNP